MAIALAVCKRTTCLLVQILATPVVELFKSEVSILVGAIVERETFGATSLSVELLRTVNSHID